jgi:hypothetical protein
MRSTTKPAHLKLAYTRETAAVSDRLQETADVYVSGFGKLFAEFLACEKIDACLIESKLAVSDVRPRLDIKLRQSSEDLVVSTKIFAAVNATTTYMSLKMDPIEIGDAQTWGDVLVEVEFVEPAPAQRAKGRGLSLVGAG